MNLRSVVPAVLACCCVASSLLSGVARAEEARLTLVDVGTTPRRTLALTLAKDGEQRLVTSVRAGDKGELPLLGRFVWRARVDDAAKGRIALTLDDAGATIERMVPREVAAEREADVRRWVAGVHGVAEVSARGVTAHLTVTVPEESNAPPHVVERRAAVRDAARTLGDLWRLGAVLLPDQPVGVGAIWRTEGTVAQRGMILRVEGRHQIVRLEGKRVTIAHRTTISAARQSLLPTEGVRSIELLRLSGSASGERTIDLGRPLPVAESARLRIDLAILIEPDGPSDERPAPRNFALTVQAEVDATTP